MSGRKERITLGSDSAAVTSASGSSRTGSEPEQSGVLQRRPSRLMDTLTA